MTDEVGAEIFYGIRLSYPEDEEKLEDMLETYNRFCGIEEDEMYEDAELQFEGTPIVFMHDAPDEDPIGFGASLRHLIVGQDTKSWEATIHKAIEEGKLTRLFETVDELLQKFGYGDKAKVFTYNFLP